MILLNDSFYFALVPIIEYIKHEQNNIHFFA